MIQIQLVDTVKGYLDVDQKSNFPINLGLAEIRDISKRTGTFSKTITLTGTKNNNNLLGGLYDVNIVDGTFNINILQKCQVINDGEVILDNLYIQLLSVNKKSNTINDEQEIEYQAVIKDTAGDFFTKINQKELTDLDLNDLSYKPDGNQLRLTKNDVVNSFDNTASDGYKFVLPWIDPNRITANLKNPSNTYALREIKPAIYAKTYWDRIWANAEYTYTWNSLTDKFIQFDKLLLPYNGDEKQMLPEVQSQFEVKLKSGNTTVITTKESNMATEAGIRRIYNDTIEFNTEIKDLENQWNTISETFTNALASTVTNNGLSVEFVFDYKLELINNETVSIKTRSNIPQSQNDILLFPIWRMYKYNDVTNVAPYTNTNQYADGLNIATVIPYGNPYPTGTTILKQDTVTISKLIDFFKINGTLSNFKAGLGTRSNNDSYPLYTPGWVKTTDNSTADYRYKITLSNMRLKFTPALGTVDYNFPIVMNGYIPKKIKQIDFIRSIAQMYNLYFIPNPLDPTNIIIETRDNYYDSGEIVDWTKKLNKDADTNIQFLPELTTKSVTISYKDDKDIANTTYKNATNETYGQVEYFYENEYSKGNERKELIFSPTPVAKTSFGIHMPILNGYNPSSNLRILLDNGSTTSNYYIEENGSTLLTTNVPLISHFSGDPLQPDFDINYFKCQYYFYNLQPTNNNLFNLHWRRTFSQINSGKMLSALFDLDTNDIRGIKLNSKIRINNSYWFINKIIDFNATIKSPTKVELISIDDDVKLSPFIDRVVSQPVENDGIVTINSNWQIESRNGFSNNLNTTGYNNSITPQSTGSIYGDNNIVNAQSNSPIQISGDNNIIVDGSTVIGNDNQLETSAFIVGNNNTVSPDAINTVILGSNINATDSNTTYTDNIQLSAGSTINGVPIENIVPDTSVTFAELQTLISTNGLVKGYWYEINDYQTIYDQPDFDAFDSGKAVVITKTATIDPIIVLATSNNTLSIEAYQPSFPMDIIHYDVNFTTTEVMNQPTKGRITYRKDEFNNETGYDHRTVLLKRYETISGSGIYNSPFDTGFASTELPTFGTNCSSNVLISNILYSTFFGTAFYIGNNVFGNNCAGNTFGDNCFNNIFGDNCDSNTFGDYCINNIYGDNCFYNTFGNYCGDNIFGNDCTRNTFGNYCSGNTFGNNCSVNTFGSNCDNNTFGFDCDGNMYGDNCVFNTFGINCNIITFGNLIRYTVFGNNCEYNTFGNNVNQGNNSTITFGIGCNNNTFGNNINQGNVTVITLADGCSSNTFGNDINPLNGSVITFGTNCTNNVFGDDIINVTFENTCAFNTFGNNINPLGGSSVIFGIACAYNTLGNNINPNIGQNVTFGDGSDRNTLLGLCSDITIDGNYNTIGEENSNINIIGVSSYNITGKFNTNINLLTSNSNTFGYNCFDITITDSNSNTFGIESNTNNLINASNYNIFENNTYSNNLDGASYNRLSYDCYNNTITNASGNTINIESYDNIITGDNNTLGKNCFNNTINGFNNTLGDRNFNNIFNTLAGSCTTGLNCTNNQFNNVNLTLPANINNRIFGNNNDLFTFNYAMYNIPFATRTTSSATPTSLYSFTPEKDGVYSIECVVTGYEAATGDSIVAKGLAAFKRVGGVLTQISTATIDRKSNFPAGVNISFITVGTLLQIVVTGRTGSTIVWDGHITITNKK